ncbi:SCO1664 family protein [Arthrobacter sp. zg-Y1110]|uniref:SCO1664 family protein n=1 Tax=Arthrobacter sp. zg-Y1110 TaxID=2886932 RepID=UPI001D135B6F|nr:SCO1664 family protein [Arthrobacter sp. zg-Y1110]MCC3292139.1 SCO1664 family protein [Arthrobacter sp. zg-Y1110]UWX85228.1 SCO1664 family protein [Arthrobacter sp. zg-Y1110]
MPTPDLVTAELTLTGRLTTASNATFLGSIGDASVVYKPIAGEKPLWDFPDGCLAHREVAAYLMSEALGWNIVPRTWLRDGRFGEGMVQLWQETDPEQTAVDLVAVDDVPETGWKEVLQGQDENGRVVSLIHEDTPALRRMAVFDALVNNADRKGDHVLAMADGHRYGVDHGLTFHSDHKLRTVLWGWIGDELSAEELEGVDRVLEGLDGELGSQLAKLLTAEEVASFAARCDRLRSAGVFPAPSGDMPAVPWPLF